MAETGISKHSKILLVDHRLETLETNLERLRREGYSVTTACSGSKGLNLIRRQQFDLLLLDYTLPADSGGNEVAAEVRKIDPYIRIVFLTSDPAEFPARGLLQHLDVQGYVAKEAETEIFLLWVETGLRAAATRHLLQKSRIGMRYILNISPDLYKMQRMEDLLGGILLQLSGLFGAVESLLILVRENKQDHFINLNPGDFLNLIDRRPELVIRAGTGKYAHNATLASSFSPRTFTLLQEALEAREIHNGEKYSIIPLFLSDQILGIIYLEYIRQEGGRQQDLLHIFADQVALAVQNVYFFEMATLDPITGLHTSHFIRKCFHRELRLTVRSCLPLTILVIKLENLKYLNDTAGQKAGDRALALLGKIVRGCIRLTDYAGRLGASEVILILPQTEQQAAQTLCTRITTLAQQEKLLFEGRSFPLKLSLSLCEIGPFSTTGTPPVFPLSPAYFKEVMASMIYTAEKRFIEKPGPGEMPVYYNSSVFWPDLPAAGSADDQNFEDTHVLY